MEDDTLANAITYILSLRVKSFPKMYVTLCPLKWYHSPPQAHALVVGRRFWNFHRQMERTLFMQMWHLTFRSAPQLLWGTRWFLSPLPGLHL